MATGQRNEALGVKLKRMLNERDISQAAFSQRTRIKPHQLSRLLSGQRKFGLPAIEASARALQISPEQLAQGTKELALVSERDRPSAGRAKRGKAASTRAASRAGAATAGQRGSELQRSSAELIELKAANRELTQRIAALETQLGASEKHNRVLRERAESAEQRLDRYTGRGGKLAAGRPAAKRRVFGAALFAGLLGLGLRAVRRAA